MIITEKAYYRVYWQDGAKNWHFEAAFVHQEDAESWHNWQSGQQDPEFRDPYRIMYKAKIIKEWDKE